MPKPELFYATNNPGKLGEVSTFLGGDWPVESPQSLKEKIEVEESGETLEENALIKARAFRAVAPPEMIVMADDTGIEIDALGGKPGVKTRRWKDGVTEMKDEEMVRHCLELLKDVPEGERGAQFRTVIALILSDGSEELFDGTLRGEIATDLDYALAHLEEGFAFRGLLYIPEAGRFLGELEDAPGSVLTHRQAAVQKAVEYLQGYNTTS